MENLQALPNQQNINNNEPQNSEEQLTLEEIEKKIKHYWDAIDKEIGYEAYFNNWNKLDYYRDLKQKLYK